MKSGVVRGFSCWVRGLIAALAMDGVSAAPGGEGARIESVERIWDAAPHNAFTDLVRHRGNWWCVFREGKGHVSPDGALRVLRSRDGRRWESSALLRSEMGDLRDAKLCVTPSGELMLSGAVAVAAAGGVRHRSLAWFSRDGRKWTDALAIGEENFWLWRTTWHGGRAYSVGYRTTEERGVRLYRSEDGRRFETWVAELFPAGYPNETALVFLPGEEALCLLRRDGDPGSGQLGVSRPPYRDWEWKDLGVKIGGPAMIRLPDGRMVAAVRLYDGRVRTSLAWVDPVGGRLTEFLPLPSGGDSSYAGLVWHRRRLWVSYYSSHEGRTSIYLARVRL